MSDAEFKRISKIFAKNLKAILNAKNMTQLELANRLGVSKSTISNWLSGLSMPRMSKINEICKILDIDIIMLIEDGNTLLSLDSEDYKFRKDYFTITKLKKALELDINISPDFIGWAFDTENFTKDELIDIFNYAEYIKSKREK